MERISGGKQKRFGENVFGRGGLVGVLVYRWRLIGCGLRRLWWQFGEV